MVKSKLVAFTVFFGEESYLLDREVQRGKGWPGRMVTYFDGSSTSESEIISALESQSFDGSEIAVIVDNAQKIKVGKEFEAYVAERKPKDVSSVLVAIYRKATITGVWAEAGRKGRLIEHKKYKPWETENIQKRLNKEAGRFGLTLSLDAFKVLQKIYGDNLQGAANEIQKMSFLVSKGGDITKDHVLSVCPRQITVMPWDVADAVSNKSLKQAMTFTSLLFRYMGDSASVPIVTSLMRQTERLLIGRSMLDQGKTKAEIGGALNMKPYTVEKQLLPTLRKHSREDLQTQMKKLCELEAQVKGSAHSKRTLVELAVHQFAA